MKLHFYYLLFLSGLFIYRPFNVCAQATFEGQILDSKTESVSPYGTVMLAKARAGTQANEQGYFSLHTNTVAEKDSLVFNCVGYKTYRMPVSAYQRNMFVVMQPNSTELREIVIRDRRKIKTLHAFTRWDIDPKESGHTLGWNYPKPFYTAQMYAKLFEAPKQDAVVTAIDLGRWQPGPVDRETEPGKLLKFKIHIITVNPVTGAPDSILATKELSLQDRARKTTVRFDSANVIVDAKKFFVAVEWLRLPYNEYILRQPYIMVSHEQGGIRSWQNGGYDRVIYQPILVSHTPYGKTPAWLKQNGVWEVFEYPKFEFALSATLNY